MQRARAMEGRRSEDGLRHGLPSRPAHADALHAARGAHGHLQRHQLGAHDPAKPARSAAASPRAPAPSTTAPTRARPPAPARAAAARAGARRATAGRAAEAAEARQEEAATPRPVRPRPTTTSAAAAAGDATATPAGARAERGQRQRAGSSWSRASRPGCWPAGVLPVHAVAAAEVGGDAEAARVLLGGVPVQLPDAGAGGHLQPRHRRQQAHHHLQRGEPKRLRHRLSAVGGEDRGPNEVPAPYFHSSPNCTGGESGSLLDVRVGVVQIKKRE